VRYSPGPTKGEPSAIEREVQTTAHVLQEILAELNVSKKLATYSDLARYFLLGCISCSLYYGRTTYSMVLHSASFGIVLLFCLAIRRRILFFRDIKENHLFLAIQQSKYSAHTIWRHQNQIYNTLMDLMATTERNVNIQGELNIINAIHDIRAFDVAVFGWHTNDELYQERASLIRAYDKLEEIITSWEQQSPRDSQYQDRFTILRSGLPSQ
jgi:hypothetical protein